MSDAARATCLLRMDKPHRNATARLLPRYVLVKALARCAHGDEAKKTVETCVCEADASGSAKRESVRKAAACVAMEPKALAQALVRACSDSH